MTDSPRRAERPLHDRWRHTCAHYDSPPGATERVWAEISERYREPQRAYHTLEHLTQLFAVFDGVAAWAHDPARCRLALWMHDIIYDPLSPHNEARSAELSDQLLPQLGVSELDRAWVAQTILATKAHHATGDADADLVIDVDMSILAADGPGFARYGEQIRQEYPLVSDEVFTEHRARFLAGVAAQERIFHTEQFRAAHEERARDNVRRAMVVLGPQT